MALAVPAFFSQLSHIIVSPVQSHCYAWLWMLLTLTQ